MVKKDLKIGDIVYCNTTYNTALKGKIKSSIQEINGVFSYEISGIDIRGSFSCSIYDMFLTKEQALNEYNEKSKNQVKKYKSHINSLEDLIRFAISYMYAEEYTNYEAIQAVKERAKEFYEIEIE